jgi:hypothetical protein
MALSLAALRDWGGEARLPFRQAVLIGLICFSAGGVPRLVPVLFGLLALIAAFHVFTVEPELPLKLFKTAFGFALALFIAYLFINALWAPERAAALVKAVTVLGLAAGAFLIAASYSLRSGDQARVLAKLSPVSCSVRRISCSRSCFHESVIASSTTTSCRSSSLRPRK